MNKSFDFNNLKKAHFLVTLPDEDKTKLRLTMPKKRTLDEFMTLKGKFAPGEIGEDAIDEIYEIVTKIININKEGKTFEVDAIEKMFDFEDVIFFIQGYTEFITTSIDSKN